MRALTLWRPWAWAIAYGGKRVENRDWRPPTSIVGEHIAIHAGKTWDDVAALEIARRFDLDVPPKEEQVAGAIVAVAHVVAVIGLNPLGAVRPFELLRGTMPATFDDRWFVGNFGIVLDEVTAIEPVPCRGAQGLWTVPHGVVEIVRERWNHAEACSRCGGSGNDPEIAGCVCDCCGGTGTER